MHIWRIKVKNYQSNWLSNTIWKNERLVIRKHKNCRTFRLDNSTYRMNISLLQKNLKLWGTQTCRIKIIHCLAHKTNFYKIHLWFLMVIGLINLFDFCWDFLSSFLWFSCGSSRLEFICYRFYTSCNLCNMLLLMKGIKYTNLCS